jgi:hypothetical protein
MTCTQNTDRECREKDCCLNLPKIVKYINKEMPIIISTCHYCQIELFRSITYEYKNMHKNLCLVCVRNLENNANHYNEMIEKYYEAFE